MSDQLIKDSLSDYTEYQFIEFLKEIRREDKATTDDRTDMLLLHFNKIIGHPSGMDLIYHPEPGADTSAEGITQTIKEWREVNGLPGFKPCF
ncbi:bacteriocin immunity protein [Stutzerimonas nitrititolerans]|uniref:bacteriocin immunity protein n=1 Tax=Stutzerimonas nitrititolerans TaxID=2482751 RepID=UPI00289BBB54|nr:bacteriocin immunity protein [Stutzerimonas nitrititolerans]